MPARLNLTGDLGIYRGDDYLLVLPIIDEDGDPFDLTGLAFAAQIREGRNRQQEAKLAASFSVTVNAGEIVLALTEAQTANLPRADKYVWDLQATGSTVSTWLTGDVEVEGDVTRGG